MTPRAAWTAWSFDPTVIILLVVAVVLYERGLRRDAARARPMVSRGQATSFRVSLLLIAVAMISPLDRMSDALLSAHMAQHLLLGLVAPLLLARARALRTIVLGLPSAVARDVRSLRRWPAGAGLRRHRVWVAAVGVAAHVGAFWFWHVPKFYDAAIDHDLLHALEHLSMLAAGLALWTIAGRGRWRESTGIAIASLFVAGLGSGGLAALLTLSPRVLYLSHTASTAPWHLSALEDQQLAGALMWVPGGLVYATVAITALVRWLDSGPPRNVAGRGTPTAPPRPALEVAPATRSETSR